MLNKTVFIMRKFLLKWPLILTMAGLIAVGCSDDDSDDNNGNNNPQTVAATVESDARFSILADALNRTNLVSVLSDANAKFTVFAPNDQAFQVLLSQGNYANLDAVIADIGNDGLRNLLLYHVLQAEVRSNQVTSDYATTAATNADGDRLSLFTQASGGVTINDVATVQDADIEASNGVIHEIDFVLSPLNVAELISVNSETYSSLLAALSVADGDLTALLSSESNTYTVFAPDNEAFDALLQATGSADLNALVTTLGGTNVLASVLLYHVVKGNVRAEDLQDNMMVETSFPNNSFTVNLGSEVTITDGQGGTSTVTQTNIQGTNGVVHRISAVLQP